MKEYNYYTNYISIKNTTQIPLKNSMVFSSVEGVVMVTSYLHSKWTDYLVASAMEFGYCIL